MNDEVYFLQRAEAEARMARMAGNPLVRTVHETLRQAYLARLDASRRDPRVPR
jgi:hypothetical protein